MEASKKWTVTYTKHIHQKRKVYHDGVLRLNHSSNKVMLYDDSDTLLDSRFLKKNEVVENGKTLTFAAYLVDVGDLDGDKKSSAENKNKKQNEKIMTKKQNESRRTNLHKIGAQQDQSAASQSGMGRKRTTLHNSDAADSQPVVTHSSVTEWDALYTTHLTQKAKKYHDGIFRLVSGTHMKQAVLLDEHENIIASNYPKSVDCVKGGVTYQLPGYLIQICEPRNVKREVSWKNNLSSEAAGDRPETATFPSSGRIHRNKILHKEILEKNSLPKEVSSSVGLQIRITDSSARNVQTKPIHDVMSNKNDNTHESVDATKKCGRQESLKNKPLRDAFQILSKLKKTVPGDFISARELTAAHDCSSESLKPLPTDVGLARREMSICEPPGYKNSGKYEVYKGECEESENANSFHTVAPSNDCFKSAVPQDIFGPNVTAPALDNPLIRSVVDFVPSIDGRFSGSQKTRIQIGGSTMLDACCLPENDQMNSSLQATVPHGFNDTRLTQVPYGSKKEISHFIEAKLHPEQNELCRHVPGDPLKGAGAEKTEPVYITDEYSNQATNFSWPHKDVPLVDDSEAITGDKSSEEMLSMAWGLKNSSNAHQGLATVTLEERSETPKKRLKPAFFPSFDLGI